MLNYLFFILFSISDLEEATLLLSTMCALVVACSRSMLHSLVLKVRFRHSSCLPLFILRQVLDGAWRCARSRFAVLQRPPRHCSRMALEEFLFLFSHGIEIGCVLAAPHYKELDLLYDQRANGWCRRIVHRYAHFSSNECSLEVFTI